LPSVAEGCGALMHPSSSTLSAAVAAASPEQRALLAPFVCEDRLEGDLLDEMAARERDCLAESGLFDAAWYAGNNPDVLRAGYGPLEPSCRYGWRRLRDPSPGFDVWWYWASHLDPSRESLNPLVHYALVGREEGLETFPPSYAPTSAGQAL